MQEDDFPDLQKPQNNNQKKNKQSHKKNIKIILQNTDVEILLNGQIKQAKNVLIVTISQLYYTAVPQLEQLCYNILNESIKASNDYEMEIMRSITRYQQLLHLMRQLNTPTPFIESISSAFFTVWSILKLGEQCRSKLFQLWTEIPLTKINQFLDTFEFRKQLQDLPAEHKMKIMTTFLNNNKIKHACKFYAILVGSTTILKVLSEYEDNFLIPRLMKPENILSNSVLQLLIEKLDLKQKILNHYQLDPQIGLRIVDALKEDGRKYQRIYNYIIGQHYRSILKKHDRWYIIEDKLSFSVQMIQMFCMDLRELNSQNAKKSYIQKLRSNLGQLSNRSQQIALSIQSRHKMKGKQIIQNPLYSKDYFGPTQSIYEQEGNYFRLIDYNIHQEDIHIIDSTDGKQFKEMVKHLMQCKQIGFDSEFISAATKYDNQGVSTIQLNFMNTNNNKQIIDFLINLLCNPLILKIGHTILSDIKQLSITLNIPNNLKIQGFVDIAQLFKKQYPMSKYSSLSYLCNFFLDKKMSKYEQRSNWNRRPLKRTQVHYSIVDSYVSLLIYDFFKNKKQPKGIHQVIKQQQQRVQQIYHDDNFVYNQKYKQYLTNPKFLIDSMLKKLCSTMRNCGIDSQYTQNKSVLLSMAECEKRIIITKDIKFFMNKNYGLPIYLIRNTNNYDQMFIQIVKKFHIDLTHYQTLSRCVKCNNDNLAIIAPQQAQQYLSFKYEDSSIDTFWICHKCKQIYWQGGQFKKAKKRFKQFQNS